tara:strand:+ start:710 stop:1360 length:651 start_codon:yes stop_codon:yes gene_type:complete
LVDGIFISFEGGEGAGKTTQVKLLKKSLMAIGINVVDTREPGGSSEAEMVRELLVSGPLERWDPFSEAMLHFVARRSHINTLIKPALDRGDWVICDRFSDSTIAYQGFGQGVAHEKLEILRELSIEKFAPDMTFILDIPAETGLKRAALRKGAESRYEKMDIGMHQRLREGFLTIAKNDPKRIKIIDATQTIQSIAEKICKEISFNFNLPKLSSLP